MDSCLYCSFHYCDLCNCHSMLSLWQILMLFLFMIFGFSGLIMSEFYYKWALNFLLVVQLSFYKSSYTLGVQRGPSFKVKLSQHIWVVSTPDSVFLSCSQICYPWNPFPTPGGIRWSLVSCISCSRALLPWFGECMFCNSLLIQFAWETCLSGFRWQTQFGNFKEYLYRSCY